MKRFHVHVSVRDLPESIRFYSSLFGAAPAVEKPDYAKWMLDDPRINFAISQRGHAAGMNHLGFQVESDEELKELRAQAAKAEIAAVEQTGTSCCYAKSDKYWVEDPQGVAWETFRTLGTVPVLGEDRLSDGQKEACCIPLAQKAGVEEENGCRAPTGSAKTKASCCG